MDTVPHEVWATYSVRDHLEPGAFINDIIFYDRLVLPIPSNEHSADGKSEWERWESLGWQPEQQKDLIKTMGDVAITVPWTLQRQQKWRERRDALHDDAFKATADLLCQETPIYAYGLAAMIGPAYPSLQKLKEDFSPMSDEALAPIPGAALPIVFGQEFLVTNYPDRSYEYQLKIALELAHNSEFRQKRAQLTQWQQKFLRDGFTDLASIAKALEEMCELIEEEKKAAHSSGLDTTVRYGYRIGMAALGVVGVVLGGAAGLVLAVGGAFMSIGELALDTKLLEPDPLLGFGQSSAAAFFTQANKAFINH